MFKQSATLLVCALLVISGGGGGSVGEPHQEKWLHHRGHLPRPFQVHPGVSRVLQGLCDLWSFLLLDPTPAHEEGAYTGGLSGQTGPSCQTHAGNLNAWKRLTWHFVWRQKLIVTCLRFQYKLTVPKVGYISDLCTSLSNLSGVPAEKVLSISQSALLQAPTLLSLNCSCPPCLSR